MLPDNSIAPGFNPLILETEQTHFPPEGLASGIKTMILPRFLGIKSPSHAPDHQA